MDKADFLKNKFPSLLETLESGVKGKWGVMNAQQMVEHMSDYVRIASGKTPVKALYDEEVTKKMHTFMVSEKPFRENTPNQLLPDVPPPCRHAGMKDAIRELRSEITDFFNIYNEKPDLKLMSPFFGELGFEEQVHLLHKHATHHLKQFGLM